MTDFADLARLHAEATPGPWEAVQENHKCYVDDDGNGCGYPESPIVSREELRDELGNPDGEFHTHESFESHHISNVTGNYDWEEGGILQAGDVSLIAAARNAIPEILRIREETLALHAEFTGLLYAECVECEVRFPCPTVRLWNGERMSVTIHRDKTFEFNGRKYAIMAGSDIRTVEWDGYTVMAVLSDEPGDYVETSESGHWRIADVRDMLDRAEEEGWEFIPDLDGNDLHNPIEGENE